MKYKIESVTLDKKGFFELPDEAIPLELTSSGGMTLESGGFSQIYHLLYLIPVSKKEV